jgi:Tfp pilus assembly protein PilF
MGRAPKSGEIILHLAGAYAAAGKTAVAKGLFDKALALDPTLAGSPEAAKIKQALK